MPVKRGYTTKDGERKGFYKYGDSGKRSKPGIPISNTRRSGPPLPGGIGAGGYGRTETPRANTSWKCSNGTAKWCTRTNRRTHARR